jgi:hypothetical protein
MALRQAALQPAERAPYGRAAIEAR